MWSRCRYYSIAIITGTERYTERLHCRKWAEDSVAWAVVVMGHLGEVLDDCLGQIDQLTSVAPPQAFIIPHGMVHVRTLPSSRSHKRTFQGKTLRKRELEFVDTLCCQPASYLYQSTSCIWCSDIEGD